MQPCYAFLCNYKFPSFKQLTCIQIVKRHDFWKIHLLSQNIKQFKHKKPSRTTDRSLIWPL